MRDKIVSTEPIMPKYYSDRYKTQEACDKAVVACLATLKLVPDSLFTSKMLEKLDNVVFSNADIDLDYIDSYIVTFFLWWHRDQYYRP